MFANLLNAKGQYYLINILLYFSVSDVILLFVVVQVTFLHVFTFKQLPTGIMPLFIQQHNIIKILDYKTSMHNLPL